jgi:hypothetical protein
MKIDSSAFHLWLKRAEISIGPYMRVGRIPMLVMRIICSSAFYLLRKRADIHVACQIEVLTDDNPCTKKNSTTKKFQRVSLCIKTRQNVQRRDCSP